MNGGHGFIGGWYGSGVVFYWCWDAARLVRCQRGLQNAKCFFVVDGAYSVRLGPPSSCCALWMYFYSLRARVM